MSARIAKLGSVMLLLSCCSLAASAQAQYSAEITRRAPASVTMGAYNSALQQRAYGGSSRSNSGFHGGHSHRGHHRWHGGGFGYPIYEYGYWNSGLVVGYGPYWPDYYLGTSSGAFGPYWAPPIYVPASQLGYGPQAVRNFMGLDQAPLANTTVVGPAVGDLNVDDGFPAEVGNQAGNAVPNNAPARGVRISNAASRKNAGQFIEYGDKLLAAGKASEALQRYKQSASTAPDLAEPHVRQAISFAYLGRYEQAAASIRRALSLNASVLDSDFRTGVLFQANPAIQDQLFSRVDKDADARSLEGEVQFVAGVVNFFGDRADSARKRFEKARQNGESQVYVDPFLQRLNAKPQPVAEAPVELDL
ncbi:MAG: hypothetical protein SGJ20_04835 [Planctomycetota bacterium]|nr:hypothetical protein [Planctomycetota bacterium]